jgi:hypothetical protein
LTIAILTRRSGPEANCTESEHLNRSPKMLDGNPSFAKFQRSRKFVERQRDKLDGFRNAQIADVPLRPTIYLLDFLAATAFVLEGLGFLVAANFAF